MRKRALDVEDAPLGIWDYWDWVHPKASQWAWLAVRTSMAEVATAYQALGRPVEAMPCNQAIAALQPEIVGLVELRGHGYEWIVVLFPGHTVDRNAVATAGKWLSEQLTTKVFWVTHTPDSTAYALLDWGKPMEAASLGEAFTFESSLRPTPDPSLWQGPAIEGYPPFIAFIHEVCCELHIYVPACHLMGNADTFSCLVDQAAEALIGGVNVVWQPKS